MSLMRFVCSFDWNNWEVCTKMLRGSRMVTISDWELLSSTETTNQHQPTTFRCLSKDSQRFLEWNWAAAIKRTFGIGGFHKCHKWRIPKMDG